MTNHSENESAHHEAQVECVPYDGPGTEHQVTLRSPAELADALPYLLGYRPEDSMVLVALHDRNGRGRFGGRARVGIPASAEDWPSAARQLAQGLITGSERRGAKPEQMVAFLCQEPTADESGRQVMRRLVPLADRLRKECGRLDVPVIEALCISDGRFWSYCCSNKGCCPDEGLPMGLPGTSVLAAAAAYAGIQVRGSLKELRARLLPRETSGALEQEIALDTAGMALVPRILDDTSRADVAEETLALAQRVMRRLAEAHPVSGMAPADLRDDELLGHDEAAALILGLQDRTTRDRAAEWMEGEEAGPALRLWRALARRCVGPYGEHAAAPLTLAGWVAWSTGDDLEAREALAMALGADPSYLFARLLHQACNEGLDPESIRRCLRSERQERKQRAAREDAGQLTARGDQERGAGGGLTVPEDAEVSAEREEGSVSADCKDVEASADGEDVEVSADREDTEVSADREQVEETAGREERPVRSKAETGGGLGRPEKAGGSRSAGPRPEVTRPAVSRADGAHPGAARAGRTRSRGSAKGSARRREACRGDARRGSGTDEGTT